ncbi:MAG: AAA family ATPase [Thermoplasmata archaeon]|nr:AAA family ATPase [Thermoplasmata archaeon]
MDLGRVVVAGDYVRFDETSRSSLKDFRGKVNAGLSGASHRPTNLLIWGPPGSGKSFLVQQVARTTAQSTRLVEINVASVTANEFRSKLAEAAAGPTDAICLIDEVDSRPAETWPYELLLPALEPTSSLPHRMVFCLAGSGGADLEEFRGGIRARPKGPDLLSRIPRGNEVSIPALGVGDRLCVAAIQLLAAASDEGHRVREVEKFALFYLATNADLQTARQLRAAAVSGALRIPPGEDRFRFDHLFAPGDPENKRFWYEHHDARLSLAGAFLAVTPPQSAHSVGVDREGPPSPTPDPTGAGESRHRIAILPFRNISPNPSDSYFSEGLTEELISTVSKIGALRVIARTSVMRFRDGTKSAAETARELRVGSLLEGSVRRAGDDLRVTAQLIDVATEEPVWSITFDRRLENVFAIQEELARRISESLHVQLVGTEGATLGRTPTPNLEAYDRYLQGRQRFFEATEPGFHAAITLFEQAIALDPQFALAYCGLAEAQALQGNRGDVPLGPALERAERSVQMALRLDPDLGEAHAAMGPILYNRYRWKEALRELDRAVALEPNNVQAQFWRAVATGAVGRPEDGLPNALRAVELDPLNPRRRVILAQQYYWMRQFDRAIDILGSPLLESQKDSQQMLAYSLLLSGRAEEAISAAERAVADLSTPSVQPLIDRAAIFARAGKPADAREILGDLLERRKEHADVPAGAIGWVLGALGEFGSAADWYVRAHEEGSIVGVPDLLVDPFLDSFRTSERYPSLLKLFDLTQAPLPVEGTPRSALSRR